MMLKSVQVVQDTRELQKTDQFGGGGKSPLDNRNLSSFMPITSRMEKSITVEQAP